MRGKEFVTRKITDGIAKIHLGQQEVLELGNLDAKRDWGFAGEYVEGMWRMLQAEEATSFVLASGSTHSVREFLQLACKSVGIKLIFEGQGESEIGIDSSSGKQIVKVNPAFTDQQKSTSWWAMQHSRRTCLAGSRLLMSRHSAK